MSALLPGFQAQLEARAQQLDDQHALAARGGAVPAGVGGGGGSVAARRRMRPRRLHGRGLAIAVLIGAAGVSGAAYAARQLLWQPQLGTGPMPRGVATGSAPPADQLRALAVLRRPQTALDRNVGSRAALELTGGAESRIRTNAVRRLATGQGGGTVVLVPYESKRGGLLDAMRPRPDGSLPDPASVPEVTVHDQLCISFVGLFPGAGVRCGDTDDLLAGKLALGMTNAQCIVPTQRRAFAQAQARERRFAKLEGRAPVTMTCSPRRDQSDMVTYWVELVPDGVATVQLSHRPGSLRVAVRDNLVQSTHNLGLASGQIWFDANGQQISRKRADLKARYGIH
jgi:hypothetical protein